MFAESERLLASGAFAFSARVGAGAAAFGASARFVEPFVFALSVRVAPAVAVAELARGLVPSA
ncbi:MAG TPA: hypothetical protein VFG30_06190, partial [Polyangiales bacterium]|nr:hypothetical protein [Polyangiales bacterium]